MTPREITRLEREAAIASELAKVATSRAQIATLEYERHALGGSRFSAVTESNFVINCLLALVLAACCVWSYEHEDQSAQTVRLAAPTRSEE